MEENMENRNLSLRAKRIRRQQNLVQLEKHLREGCTNQMELAAAFHVSQPTISRWIKMIYENWLREDPSTARRERQLRIRQLEAIARKALIDYERSRLNSEETSVVETPEKCPICRGSGMNPNGDGEWCSRCEGDGEIKVKTVARKVKGQAGDVNFLRTAKECFVECAKLKALHMQPRGKTQPSRIQVNQIVGSQTLDLSKVSSEDLLEAKEALSRLKTGPAKQIEGRVIKRED